MHLIDGDAGSVHELILGVRQLTGDSEQYLTPDTCQQGTLERQLIGNESEQVRCEWVSGTILDLTRVILQCDLQNEPESSD